jgi:hypothetical protein
VNVTGAGATALTVDDSGDTNARSATLSDGAITGLAPATISWTPTSSATGGVTGLTVKGGSGGNTFTVTNTSNFSNNNNTYLSTGTGNDFVNVSGTTGALNIYSPGGQDSVLISIFGSLLFPNVQSINGPVNVTGVGTTSLNVDDTHDHFGRTATLSDGAITGLTPATISYGGGVSSLQVYGGSGGNAFTVTNTSNFSNNNTYLSTGTGNDTVNVYATTGALNVDNPGGQDSVYLGSNGSALGGNVQGINGPVNVTGAGGTTLVVDDSSDTTGHMATLSDRAITGLAKATISWAPTSSATGGVTGLAVYGGAGGNSFTIANTSNFLTSTKLTTGTGSDTVNVQGTTGALNVVNPGEQDTGDIDNSGSVQGIIGGVIVSGAAPTFLHVDDSSDTTGRMVTLSDKAISGLAPATISWTPTGIGGGLDVLGGSGGNTFTVTNIIATTSLTTGTGNDTVNVNATNGNLNVVNPGGQDSVYLGSNGSALGGNVQGIHRPVDVLGAGATSLFVDDSGDTTGRTATLSNGRIIGLAPTVIIWTPTRTATGGCDQPSGLRRLRRQHLQGH